MKITKFVTILLIIPCLISCYGNKSSKTTQSNNADYDIRLNDSIAAVNAMLEEGNADGEKMGQSENPVDMLNSHCQFA